MGGGSRRVRAAAPRRSSLARRARALLAWGCVFARPFAGPSGPAGAAAVGLRPTAGRPPSRKSLIPGRGFRWTGRGRPAAERAGAEASARWRTHLVRRARRHGGSSRGLRDVRGRRGGHSTERLGLLGRCQGARALRRRAARCEHVQHWDLARQETASGLTAKRGAAPERAAAMPLLAARTSMA